MEKGKFFVLSPFILFLFLEGGRGNLGAPEAQFLSAQDTHCKYTFVLLSPSLSVSHNTNIVQGDWHVLKSSRFCRHLPLFGQLGRMVHDRKNIDYIQLSLCT